MGSTARQIHRAFNVDHLNINLNDSFEADMNPNVRGFDNSQDSPSNVDAYSAGCSQSAPSGGTSTSRGTKRKSPMSDFIEAHLEKLTCGLDKVVDAIISGNTLSQRLIEVAEKQVDIAERQVSALEKRNDIINEQVSILKKSSTIQYSEEEIWRLLEEMNIPDHNFMIQCYDYLCNNEPQRRRLFGMPRHLWIGQLLKMLEQSHFQ